MTLPTSPAAFDIAWSLFIFIAIVVVLTAFKKTAKIGLTLAGILIFVWLTRWVNAASHPPLASKGTT